MEKTLRRFKTFVRLVNKITLSQATALSIVSLPLHIRRYPNQQDEHVHRCN